MRFISISTHSTLFSGVCVCVCEIIITSAFISLAVGGVRFRESAAVHYKAIPKLVNGLILAVVGFSLRGVQFSSIFDFYLLLIETGFEQISAVRLSRYLPLKR